MRTTIGLVFVLPGLVIPFGPAAYSVMMVVLLAAYSVAFWTRENGR